MPSIKIINNFLKCETIAIAGVSRNEKKFGFIVYKTLLKNGFNIYPINPKTTLINKKICYKTLSDINEKVDHLLIVSPKTQCLGLVNEAIEKGINNIWIQQGCDTSEAISTAKNAGINLISKKCILMFTDPKGIHKFHKTLSKLFGFYPKKEITTNA